MENTGELPFKLNPLKELSNQSGIRVKDELRDNHHFWYLVYRDYRTQRERIPKELGLTVDKKEHQQNLAALRRLAIKNAVEHASQYTLLEKEAAVDGLTGAFNRRALDRYLLGLLSKRRTGTVDVAVLFDVDKFKSFNDQYGHLVGDSVLKELVKLIQSKIRGGDFLARYGGEEFALVMPQVNDDLGEDWEETVLQRIDSIRQTVADELKTRVEKATGQPLDRPVTASFGVKIIEPTVIINNEDDLKHGVYEKVDQYLYQAKESGRNVVIDAKGKYPRES